jgi:rhodanese-related sulfurtransferase
MKILLTWFALMGLGFADVSVVKIEEAEKLIAEKVQLLDVRTEEEWNEGHLEGAVRVDFTAKGFAEKVVKAVDPKKPVLIYCRSGGRSGRASKAMAKLGFVEIKDLDGGITAWQKAGKKVVK